LNVGDDDVDVGRKRSNVEKVVGAQANGALNFCEKLWWEKELLAFSPLAS
jgi:hypothetical protein